MPTAVSKGAGTGTFALRLPIRILSSLPLPECLRTSKQASTWVTLLRKEAHSSTFLPVMSTCTHANLPRARHMICYFGTCSKFTPSTESFSLYQQFAPTVLHSSLRTISYRIAFTCCISCFKCPDSAEKFSGFRLLYIL